MKEITFGKDKYGRCKSCGSHSLDSLTLGRAESALKRGVTGLNKKEMEEFNKKIEQYVRSFCGLCLKQLKSLDIERKAIAVSLIESSKYDWNYSGDMKETVEEWEHKHPEEAKMARQRIKKKFLMDNL